MGSGNATLLKPSVLHPLCSDLSGVIADNEGSSSEQAEGSQRNDEEREERGVGTQEKVQ